MAPPLTLPLHKDNNKQVIELITHLLKTVEWLECRYCQCEQLLALESSLWPIGWSSPSGISCKIYR